MTRKKFVLLFRIIFYLLLFLVLVFALYFRNHTDSFYAKLGNFYYNRNNNSKALDYYEKSMLSGNKDFEIRSRYVNIIINSPLTIKAQERLVKIAQDEIDDSASSEAAYFLYNLKREIKNKYPESYIQNSPYSQKIIHWGKMPITYEFRNTHSVPKEFIQEITNAFNEWERVSSGRVKFSNVALNANIVIDFDTHSKKGRDEDGQKYVIAYTTPQIIQNTLELMNIKFSIYDPDGKMFTPNQIYNTALHEIFHALGFMGHSYEKDSIMYMTREHEVVEGDARVRLTDADKVTFALLYMIKPDITNAEEIEYKYVPYLVLGDSDQANYLKLLEAKNYVYHAPSLPGGYIDMAESLASDKKYDEAIKNLEKAYRLTSYNDYETKYIIFYNLAVTHYYTDNYEMAFLYIEKAKKIHDNPELHLLSAEIYVKKNQIEQAIEEYNYLISKKPDNIDYVVNLAGIYVNKKKYISARNVIKNYLKNNPQMKGNPKLTQFKFLLF